MANKRLIDANALMDAFRSYMVERYDKEKCISEENCKTCDKGCLWRKFVSAAPTVDAVEVVRCENCKHYDSFCGVCQFLGSEHMSPSDFCSYGEVSNDGKHNT